MVLLTDLKFSYWCIQLKLFEQRHSLKVHIIVENMSVRRIVSQLCQKSFFITFEKYLFDKNTIITHKYLFGLLLNCSSS